MNKILTITLTIFKPTIEEIKNFFFSVEKINEIYRDKENLVQFMIISDNPELDEEVVNLIEKKVNELNEFENIEFIGTNENLGKTWQIFRNLERIKGDFVKMADPDDFLIPNETVDFIEEKLKKLPKNSLIINSYNQVFEKITKENFTNLENKRFFKKASFNPNSTYPLEILKKVIWDFNLLIWSDDLLGYMLLKEGANIVEIPDNYFYINQSHAGVSVTKAKHSNMKFYNDTILYLSKVEEMTKTDFDLAAFKMITEKPSKWMLEKVANDLSYNESLTAEERFSLLKKVEEKMYYLSWNRDGFKRESQNVFEKLGYLD